MKFILFLITLTSWLNIIFGQFKYEFEFINEKIYTPCEDYPNNFIDNLFDMSNVNFDQTEDGSIVVNGYCTVENTVDRLYPLSIEVFKKERGTWQPTIYSQKRDDTCSACFSKSELWNKYLENTPEEQLSCPFTKGQRIDFDISEPTYLSFPVKNGEGEFKIQAKAGAENDDLFVCVDILVMVHKM